MIRRRNGSELVRLLDQYPAVVLLGPRQVGKTTLALTVASARPSIYLDLESESDLAKLADPELYLGSHQDRLVVLAEVQRELLPSRPLATCAIPPFLSGSADRLPAALLRRRTCLRGRASLSVSFASPSPQPILRPAKRVGDIGCDQHGWPFYPLGNSPDGMDRPSAAVTLSDQDAGALRVVGVVFHHDGIRHPGDNIPG